MHTPLGFTLSRLGSRLTIVSAAELKLISDNPAIKPGIPCLGLSP
jgi:hypothetical protein